MDFCVIVQLWIRYSVIMIYVQKYEWHSTSAVHRLKNSVGRDSVQYLGQICLCNKRLWLIKIYSYEAFLKVHTVEHLCNIFQIHSGLE